MDFEERIRTEPNILVLLAMGISSASLLMTIFPGTVLLCLYLGGALAGSDVSSYGRILLVFTAGLAAYPLAEALRSLHRFSSSLLRTWAVRWLVRP